MSLVCPVGPEANLLEVGPEHCHRLMVNHPVLTLEQLEVRREGGREGGREGVLSIPEHCHGLLKRRLIRNESS